MVKILLFDDNRSLRESIKILLETNADFHVVGDFDDPHQIMELVKTYRPHIIIMDIDMPKMNGIEATQKIKSLDPAIDIIMLTVFEDDQRLFASICAGASGYLLKMHSHKLTEAIREVLDGGAPMSPGIARRVLAYFQATGLHDYDLTVREKEILDWLVKGYSYKMIADECHVSYETVKTHLRNIYQKLHVNCGTEAVAKAVRERIV